MDTLVYRYWLPHQLPRVGAVITVSDHSRADIQRYLGIPSGRLKVIPYGVAARFRPLAAQRAGAHLRNRFDLSAPYVLFVGALTKRKNIETALEAFAQVDKRFPNHRFVLTGPRIWKGTPVDAVAQRLRIADKILVTGPLTDADLPTLYSCADVFVFPSLYEGFGLPPLEAMACGTPVICSNASSLPEVVGDAAIMVDPHDVEGLAGAMHRVLADPGLREELQAKGLARAREFTWERTARETVAVYQEVCK